MDDIPMWLCPSCKDLNAVGLEVCRCGELRPSAYSIRFIEPQSPLALELLELSTPNAAKRGKSPVKRQKEVSKKEPKLRKNQIPYDGFLFDSKIEYQRYLFLLDCQQHGRISGLQVHPTYTLAKPVKLPASFLPSKTQGAITYTPDFVYRVGGLTIYEDTKGAYGYSKKNVANKKAGKPIVTEAARLRHKLFIAKLATEGSNFHFDLVTVATKAVHKVDTVARKAAA